MLDSIESGYARGGSLNYYRRYVGDFLKKTIRLSMAGHGAYNLLLDYYYAEEKPIPLDLEEVYVICRAMRDDDRAIVDRVLADYFVKQSDGFHNQRADEEIAVSIQARENGSHGGRKKTGTGTGSITGSVTGNGTGTGAGEGGGLVHPPTTNHQPPTTSLHPPPNAFDQFWQAYPRKQGKAAAIKAWGKVEPSMTAKQFDHIMSALDRQKKSKQWSDPSYIPHASTWINGARWDDEVIPVGEQKPSGAWRSNDAAVLEMAKRYSVSTMGKRRDQIVAEIEGKIERGG